MGVYVEVTSIHSRRGQVQHQGTIYCQPARDHLVAQAYHQLWERPTGQILRRVEMFFLHRHTRSCLGCTVGYSPDEQKVWVCGYLPLTARQDVRCDDLHRRRREDITQFDLTGRDYERIASAQGYRVQQKTGR